jgi:hypothetical protein
MIRVRRRLLRQLLWSLSMLAASGAGLVAVLNAICEYVRAVEPLVGPMGSPLVRMLSLGGLVLLAMLASFAACLLDEKPS